MTSKLLTTVAALGVAGLSAWKVLTRPARPQTPSPSIADVTKRFEAKFPALTQDLLDHVRDNYELPPQYLERLRKMLDYTCVGGKMTRGLTTVFTVLDAANAKAKLRDGVTLDQLVDQAIVVGWCIEILQALFLVADDMMDSSPTRRGQPCWYKLPEIQLDAINDTLILESTIYLLLKKYIKPSSHAVYHQLIELFQETSLQTEMGQMLDLVSQPQGARRNERNMAQFNMKLYQLIVKYKTAYYSFYLPIAAGLIVSGISDDESLKTVETISIALGEKFQIQDDYLDCFGEPEVIGKVGTDIQDHKCTWLLITAMRLMSSEQKALLQQHYGSEEEKSVTLIKQLYRDVGVLAAYEEQEQRSHDQVQQLIKQNKTQVPNIVFERMLQKIHKRNK